jgi:hypothetical protein
MAAAAAAAAGGCAGDQAGGAGCARCSVRVFGRGLDAGDTLWAIAEIAGRAVVSQKRWSSNGSLGLGRPSEKVECAPPKTCRRHIQTFCVAAWPSTASYDALTASPAGLSLTSPVPACAHCSVSAPPAQHSERLSAAAGILCTVC